VFRGVAVAKRKSKLNVAPDDGFQHAEALNITEKDWSRIEKAYQRALTDGQRKLILSVTVDFLIFVPGEAAAEAVRTVANEVGRVRKACKKFLDLYMQNINSNSQGSALISEKFKIHMRHKLFYRYLTSYIDACDWALAEIKDPKNHGWRQGDMWNMWVKQLTTIAREGGLPHQARQDEDATKTRSSPFVMFVHELQKCIPLGFRRSTHSESALATAINRARRVKYEKLKPGIRPVL